MTSHFAVIFTSTLVNSAGYDQTAKQMDELARSMPGFLGVESVRAADGRGKAEWYSSWKLRIAKIEGPFLP